MHWIDIVIITIIALTTIIGLARGLFESVLSIFGTALSLFISIWASKPVSQFVNKIVNVNSFAEKFLVNKGIAENGIVKIPLLGSFTTAAVANFLGTIMIVFALFILIKIVIFLLSKLFDSATSSSATISGLNRLLGAVFGFAKGTLFVGMFFALASVLSFLNIFSATISDNISKTNSATQFVYNKVDDWTIDKFKDQIIKFLGDPETDNGNEENDGNEQEENGGTAQEGEEVNP